MCVKLTPAWRVGVWTGMSTQQAFDDTGHPLTDAYPLTWWFLGLIQKEYFHMGAKVAAQDIPCGMCLHSCVCVCVCVCALSRV